LKEKNIPQKFYYIILFIIHFSSFILNYKYSIEVKRDSFNFYQRAIDSTNIFDYANPGSRFITFLIYPLVKLNFDYFVISLIFSIISFIGFLIFLRQFDCKEFYNKLLIIILLFPSLHFWSSGLSKEALVVFFMALVFAQVKKKKPLLIWLVISLIFLLFIRPYLSLIILMSLLITFYIYSKKSRLYKIKFALLSFMFFICSLPILKVFLKIETISIDSISYVFAKINTYSLNHGNSSIPLESTNYLERINIVLYRPFFLDVNSSLLYYIISFENLLFLITTILFLYLIFRKKTYLNQISFFLLSTSLLIILFLSLYMYNLGLASRMKVMFIPYLALGIYLSQKKQFFYEKEIN